MDLHSLFEPADLLVGFEPADKWDAIRGLVAHLVARGALAAELEETVLGHVLDRERSMSTGMERGIAIPHAAVDEVDEILACMGIVTTGDGLKFESVDGAPARLVVLLVIPRSKKLLHIRTLADVARVLGRDDVREALLASTDADEAWAVLTAGDAEAQS